MYRVLYKELEKQKKMSKVEYISLRKLHTRKEIAIKKMILTIMFSRDNSLCSPQIPLSENKMTFSAFLVPVIKLRTCDLVLISWM